MAKRTTNEDIRRREAILNEALKKAGQRVVVQGRYGYQGVDLYDARGLRRTLTTGISKGQAKDYLEALITGIDLYRGEA